MASVAINSLRRLRYRNIYGLCDKSFMVMIDYFRLWNMLSWLNIALSSMDTVSTIATWTTLVALAIVTAISKGRLGGLWRSSMASRVTLAHWITIIYGATLRRRVDMHSGTSVHSRASLVCSISWCRMTTMAYMRTGEANRATRVAIATLTTVTVSGVCFGRSIAITLVSEATMATMAAMTHRTAIPGASRVVWGSTIAHLIYLATMTSLIAIVWTTMVMMDDDGSLSSITTVAITWTLERYGFTDSSN